MPTAPQTNFQDPDHKKWYQKTGWIIALLILIFPVGLFLMWKYTNWKKTGKGNYHCFNSHNRTFGHCFSR